MLSAEYVNLVCNEGNVVQLSAHYITLCDFCITILGLFIVFFALFLLHCSKREKFYKYLLFRSVQCLNYRDLSDMSIWSNCSHIKKMSPIHHNKQFCLCKNYNLMERQDQPKLNPSSSYTMCAEYA